MPTGRLINGQWRDASDGGTFDMHATGEVPGHATTYLHGHDFNRLLSVVEQIEFGMVG